jgi:Flp pilus assembly pilin Flp
MAKLFCWFVRDGAEATTAEYGLIAFGIGLAMVVSLVTLGADLNSGVVTVDYTFQ